MTDMRKSDVPYVDTTIDKPRVFLVRKAEYDIGENISPLPRYSRTRTVTVRQISIDFKDFVCIECDCYFFLREKCLCRHVYRVIDMKPSHRHVFPECLKAYEAHIGKDAEGLKKCRELTDTFLKYQGLVVPGKLKDIQFSNDGEYSAEHSIEWFLDAQARLIDVNALNESQNNEIVFETATGDIACDSEEDVLLRDLVPQKTPTMPKSSRHGAYSNFHSEFSDVCNHVKESDADDPEVRRVFEEGFSLIRRGMLRFNSGRGNNITGKGPASFKAAETVPKRKRKSPIGSPSTFKK